MILVVDFGSQTAHLIERRVKELGAATRFVTPEEALAVAKKEKVDGIILSGGPSSVYDSDSPTIDSSIFSLGIPVLAICYGMQLMMHSLGGKVVSGKKEYGPSELHIANCELRICKELPRKLTVWMSHGDEIEKLPGGFKVVGQTAHAPFAFVANEERRLYGLLFHPEVEHTEYGDMVLQNFLSLAGVTGAKKEIDVEALVHHIKEQVGDAVVIGAVSGGVDSTVAAALTAKAISQQFVPFYVDNGLMRVGTTEQVKTIFNHIGVPVDIISCEDEMLDRLKEVTDPERKRKIIGAFYIELFEREMEKLRRSGRDVRFLLQGTIYSDVIESKGTKHASKIKSHHNVGGLPETMQLKLLEPVREFYKDEVRMIGRKLGLPEAFVAKQPFPGPGYGVRIRGEVTKKRLQQERLADAIVVGELEKAGLLNDVFQSFTIMSGADSTAVKGDGRFFGEVVAVRVVQSRDVMTAKWAQLPYEVLQSIASRIVNEVPDVSRVVYDITTKPPATMEWE